jgi:tape measure domain-containing protein
MALDVGTLVANLKLDRSDFNRGVKESEGTFSRLGGVLGAGVKRVAALGGAAIAAGGAVGLRTAARMEQANIAFTTMLGSGERARAFLGELSAFAAKTPFEFPELQAAASSLVSAGVEADRVIPIMSTLGDVTSGMGTGSEGIKRATVALQQMNAAGRITGEDLNQLRDAGIPVYDLLAAATGKSKEAVAELARKGKLGREELTQLMEALESGKGLERFNGLMEAQSQSLTGMWSTLKDTFSMGMATAIEPLIPLIKDGLGGATAFVAANTPKLAAGLASVTGAVTTFVAGFKGAPFDELGRPLEGAAAAGHRVREALSAARAAVVGLFPAKATGEGIDWASAIEKGQAAAGRLWPQIVSAAQSMQGLGPVVDVTGAVFGFLADHIDTVIKYLPLLIAGFVAFKAAQALGNVVALASLPIQAATVASNFAAAGANRALAAAIAQQTAVQNANQAATARGTVATIASTVASKAAAAASKVWAAGQWLLNAALSANPIGLIVIAIAALVAGLVLAWRNSETFRNVVTGVFGAVQRAAGDAVGFMIQGFRGLLAVWLTVADGIISGAATALGWIPGLGGKLKEANRAFDTMKEGILDTLDDAADKAHGFGEETGGNLASGISSQRDEAERAGARVANAAAGGARATRGNSYGAGLTVGQALGAGLVRGLNEYDRRVHSAAAELGAGAAAAVRIAAQVRSPSRLTAYVGEMIGAGLVVGMDGMTRNVAVAAGQLAGAAIPNVPAMRLPAGAARAGDGFSAGTGPGVGTVRLADDQLDDLARRMAWALETRPAVSVLDGQQVGRSVQRQMAWAT